MGENPWDDDEEVRAGGGDPGGGYAGLLEAGNIDLAHRPRVKNRDGSISTVRSISVNMDGREILIPTVSEDGRIMSNREAVQAFERTGKHLGMFDSPQHATSYAQGLHNAQAKMIEPDSPWDHDEEVARPAHAEAGFSQGKPQGLLAQGWDSIRNSLFGSPERQDAQARGDLEGVSQPTTAQMLDGAMLAGGMMGGPEAAIGAFRGGKALIQASPRIVGAVTGAVPGLLHGKPKEAAIGAITGAVTGSLPGILGRAQKLAGMLGGAEEAAPAAIMAAQEAKVLPSVMSQAEAQAQIQALLTAGKTREARGLIEAIRSNTVKLAEEAPAMAAAAPQMAQEAVAAAEEAPAVVQAAGASRPFQMPQKGNVRPATVHTNPNSPTRAVREATRKAAQEEAAGADLEGQLSASLNKPVDRGQAAATAHRELMTAAKEAVQADPSYGEKVWVALDKAGKPAGTFKSEPAARAAAKRIGGTGTTWARNPWRAGGID